MGFRSPAVAVFDCSRQSRRSHRRPAILRCLPRWLSCPLAQLGSLAIFRDKTRPRLCRRLASPSPPSSSPPPPESPPGTATSPSPWPAPRCPALMAAGAAPDKPRGTTIARETTNFACSMQRARARARRSSASKNPARASSAQASSSRAAYGTDGWLAWPVPRGLRQ